METQKDLEKNHKIYKISDLMSKIKVTARTIRYYDSEGLLGDVKRSVGYTRYFTDDDVVRMKEIIKLKKKGLKIADIKVLFKEKYNKSVTNTFPNIALSDVFLSESDIPTAQDLGIEIIQSDLKYGSVKIPYQQWQTVAAKIESKPFEVLTSKKSNRKLQSNISSSKSWIGNAGRGIFHYIVKNNTKKYCTESKIKGFLNQSFEWIIVPSPVSTNISQHKLSDNYYFIQQRLGKDVFESVFKESLVFYNLEKQIKEAIAPFNGVMNQVTIHYNPKDKVSKKLMKELKQMFPNEAVLNIESITPFYQAIAGVESPIFLSII
jgi:DNA-binding transcriptional MerR regulator